MWILDVGTGKPIGPSLRHETAVSSAGFSPDGTLIVSCSGDGTVFIWDVRTSEVRSSIRRQNQAGEGFGQSTHAWFSRDSRRLIVSRTELFSIGAAFRDSHLQIWDATTGLPLSTSMRGTGAAGRNRPVRIFWQLPAGNKSALTAIGSYCWKTIR